MVAVSRSSLTDAALTGHLIVDADLCSPNDLFRLPPAGATKRYRSAGAVSSQRWTTHKLQCACGLADDGVTVGAPPATSTVLKVCCVGGGRSAFLLHQEPADDEVSALALVGYASRMAALLKNRFRQRGGVSGGWSSWKS